jgi:hypothetical protein
MLLIDVPEMDYIVFEHGPFNYEEEKETVFKKLEEAINAFDYAKTEYKPDYTSGRIAYGIFDPQKFEKNIKPVIKK